MSECFPFDQRVLETVCARECVYSVLLCWHPLILRAERHVNRRNVNLAASGHIQVNIASLTDCGENKFAKSSATLHSVNVPGVGYLADALAD